MSHPLPMPLLMQTRLEQMRSLASVMIEAYSEVEERMPTGVIVTSHDGKHRVTIERIFEKQKSKVNHP